MLYDKLFNLCKIEICLNIPGNKDNTWHSLENQAKRVRSKFYYPQINYLTLSDGVYATILQENKAFDP